LSGRFLLRKISPRQLTQKKNNYNDTRHNNFFCGGDAHCIQRFDFVALKEGDIMKKFFAAAAIVAFIAALAFPAAQAAGNFSDWKCSQCGKTRHKAGQNPPQAGESKCPNSGDGRHIWFKT